MTYAPWVEQRRVGYVFLAAGAVSLCFAWFALAKGYAAWGLMGILALAFFAIGLTQLKRAKHREFGKEFERDAIARALPALTGLSLTAQANHIVSYGDIDILATGARCSVPIEVKSFVRWHRHWFLSGEREQKAIRQARRQRSLVRAPHAVIWLPQGRPTLLQRLIPRLACPGDVRVVFGNERTLAHAVRRLAG